jgi:hypothetical protein
MTKPKLLLSTPSACIPLLWLLSLKVDGRSRLNDVCYIIGNIFYDPEALVLEFMLVCSPYVLNTEASILTCVVRSSTQINIPPQEALSAEFLVLRQMTIRHEDVQRGHFL